MPAPASLHALTSTKIDGTALPLSSLSGKAAVVVNVAADEAATKRSYERLAAWHGQHGSALEILLYPSDEFGRQELPSAEIPAFVAKFGLPTDGGGCTLMSKVEVNGGREDPVWAFLKAGGKDVSWNFAAFFVVGKDGQVVGRFSSRELDACGEAAGGGGGGVGRTRPHKPRGHVLSLPSLSYPLLSRRRSPPPCSAGAAKDAGPRKGATFALVAAAERQPPARGG
eukprot:CAMPEP_0185507474 /NCGR_PEP_ID=MMETSP1366-20130426/42066_1 /TAXON_ID=38817 /ORGANISM="Gephyrocapsa oceanica, Strain RCC1303" /LENGTH=225 /DNA_ID=CAMNT_0028117741 /DNA_START=94 /DNA_END=766 /DNA_ORIENTATION=+